MTHTPRIHFPFMALALVIAHASVLAPARVDARGRDYHLFLTREGRIAAQLDSVSVGDGSTSAETANTSRAGIRRPTQVTVQVGAGMGKGLYEWLAASIADPLLNIELYVE